MPILMGATSSDKRLSIFLSSWKISSEDGRAWPLLDGLLTVEKECVQNENLIAAIEVECVFKSVSPLGVKQEKVIFSSVQHLLVNEEQPLTEDGLRVKLPFIFDFKTKSLAPSLHFDDGSVVAWSLVGFLAKGTQAQPVISRDEMKVLSQAHIPFHCSYSYTAESFRDHPVFLKPVTAKNSSFTVFKPNTSLEMSLADPLFIQKLDRGLKISLALNNASANSARFLHVKVMLKQKILVQVYSIKTRFKRSLCLFNEAPAPSYYIHPAGSSIHYDLVLSNIENLIQQSNMAKVYLDGSNYGFLIGSTLYSQHSGTGTGIECEYSLKVMVSVADDDPSSVTAKPTEFSGTVPLLVSLAAMQDDLNVMPADSFLSIVSSLLEDIGSTLEGLDTLINSFNGCVRGGDMVTFKSDHARFILDELMPSFQIQIGFFEDHIRNPSLSKRSISGWREQGRLPFNLLLLELELLSRAATASPDSSERDPIVMHLLQFSRVFLERARSITMTWIRTVEVGQLDMIQDFHIQVANMCKALSQIAQ